MMSVHCKGPVRTPVTCFDPSPVRALSRPGSKNELTGQTRKVKNTPFGDRKRNGLVVLARATKPSTGTAILGNPFGGGGDIFVAGATGQIGARIVKELLQGGQKVIAAVQDVEEGAALLDFAKRFQLLKGVDAGKVRLAEVDFSDEDAIAAAIPKRGKVVVIVGDTGVKGKADAQLPLRIIEAAQQQGASRLVLVAPGGGGGGGGFFGGGRGGAPGKPPPPSKLEEEVANSGLSFAIVRTGKYEDDSLGEEANLVLGGQGSLPAGARISKLQAAEIAALMLRTATDDVLVEAWASPEAEAEPVDELLAEVLPRATIGEDAPAQVEEEEEEEEEAAPVAKAGAKPGGFSLFPPRTPPAAKPVEEEEEEEDEAPAPVRKPAFGFGFGGGKAAAPQAVKPVPDEEAEEEEKPPKKGLFGGFGSKKKPLVEEVEEEDEEAAKPAKPLFGGFGVRAAKAATVEPEEEKPAKKGLFGFGGKAAPKEEEKEPEKPAKKGLFGFGGKAPKEEEEEEEPKKPLGGLFGGTRKIQKEEPEPATPRRTPPPMPSGQMLTIRGRASSPAGGAPARTPRRGPAPQPKAPPPAAKSVRGTTSGPVVRGRNPIPADPPKPSRAPAKGAEEKAPPKKGGFLQSLGIGQDTAFVDELD